MIFDLPNILYALQILIIQNRDQDFTSFQSERLNLKKTIPALPANSTLPSCLQTLPAPDMKYLISCLLHDFLRAACCACWLLHDMFILSIMYSTVNQHIIYFWSMKLSGVLRLLIKLLNAQQKVLLMGYFSLKPYEMATRVAG